MRSRDLKYRVVHIISSFNRGGRERQLATIYKYSDKETFSTKIVCFNRTLNSYIEEYDMSDAVIYLSSKSFIQRFREIRRIAKESETDIIWTWGGAESTFGILLSLTTKVKHINGSIRHGIVKFELHQLWRMLILHLSKNVVANSKAGLKANGLKRGYVLYNGLDEKFFEYIPNDRHKKRVELNIKEPITVLTSVANFVPYKDYYSILVALKKTKEKSFPFCFIAVGEGPERKNIEKKAEELGLFENIRFVGRRTDVKEILHVSDIFIHSSVGEGCSNAIIEAMASGLPIIASNTGGTSEVVDLLCGRLFEYKNVDSLSDCIEELISNSQLRIKLSENARAKALKQFSIERMMTEYFQILNGINAK